MLKVKNLMQTSVFTVAPDDNVDRVFFLLHYEKIRHLPVIEKNTVVGVVSDRDLYKALGPRTRSNTVVRAKDGSKLHVIPRKVRHIMHRGVITIAPEASISEAAALMARRKIGALPVVKSRKLVGIITSTDLLRSFAKMSADLSRMMGKY